MTPDQEAWWRYAQRKVAEQDRAVPPPPKLRESRKKRDLTALQIGIAELIAAATVVAILLALWAVT